jgi:catechol 2,3-dioxygenase-like lactoylglutathione lyase family enzyme
MEAEMIEGLSHITLIVSDLGRMEDFLTHIFDAKVIYSSGDATFSISREKFFLISGLWIAIMEGEPLPDKTYNHVAFKIREEDFDAHADRVRLLGIEVRERRKRLLKNRFGLLLVQRHVQRVWALDEAAPASKSGIGGGDVPYDPLCFLCGLSGALHAIAVVLALRSKSSRLSRFGFVMTTAALSIAAPFAALKVIDLLGLAGIATIFVALALTSAIGAVSYWLLVRGLWARFLSPRSLLVTVGSCVLATFIASVAISVVPFLRDVLLPMFWWLAFSASLLIADRHNTVPNRPLERTRR